MTKNRNSSDSTITCRSDKAEVTFQNTAGPLNRLDSIQTTFVSSVLAQFHSLSLTNEMTLGAETLRQEDRRALLLIFILQNHPQNHVSFIDTHAYSWLGSLQRTKNSEIHLPVTSSGFQSSTGLCNNYNLQNPLLTGNTNWTSLEYHPSLPGYNSFFWWIMIVFSALLFSIINYCIP